MAAAHGRRRRVALPWTVRLRLCGLEAAIDVAQCRDGGVNRSLFSLFDRRTPADPRPDATGVGSTDITVDASRGLWARVFTVAERSPSPRPVIVYFHGGGFTLFSAASRTYDALCRTLCGGLGAVVVSVNYRLAPEHRAPAAYDDGEAVLRYLATTGLPGHVSPVDVSACFVAGDSAGGNIAHHVAHRWTAATSASTSPVHLAGVILVQPCFSGEERTKAERALDGVAPMLNTRRTDLSWKAFLPEGADRNHPAAHVTGGDDGGPEHELPESFPPAMVVIGGLDSLHDWGRRYGAMLRRKGRTARVVEFPDSIHAFYVFPELADDSRKLVDEIRAFVEEIIRSKQSTS
ncbi:probable carboxylesterase 18 [Oryza brachyantha]|uniref:probable carboxylesterase 18 n=1 Tax=Oryza brachyantha TaxID=4533 RepID=UPI001AD9D10E|nr:probable carboxylesterase 18 [Oryza brachyantha]